MIFENCLTLFGNLGVFPGVFCGVFPSIPTLYTKPVASSGDSSMKIFLSRCISSNNWDAAEQMVSGIQRIAAQP